MIILNIIIGTYKNIYITYIVIESFRNVYELLTLCHVTAATTYKIHIGPPNHPSNENLTTSFRICIYAVILLFTQYDYISRVNTQYGICTLEKMKFDIY